MAFVGVAIGAIAGALGVSTVFVSIVGRLLLSVALSALQRALMPKPREPGIKTKVTQTGGLNPQAFPLMRYATAGTHACPPMSHGSAGKTPNAFLTYVIVLSDVPGCSISRVMVNNEYITLGVTPHPDYGRPATGRLSGHAWVKFHDGTQTTADAMLLARYGIYPERPWTSDMIGRGTAYAIVTFKYDRDRFPSLPRCRFEMNGIPLYDPRRDTTVGGSGAHRWADKATWAATVNPYVAIYNTLRGVGLLDGSVWGGGFPAEDVPLASWFAAMNECDLLVTNGVGTEAQFRAGFEVSVDEEPADVIGELMKTCAGNIAEIGGLWKARAGAPGTAVYVMTDADIVISSPQDFRPFPNMAGSFNGAHATYPDPAKSWESSEAVPYYNATHEAADRAFRLTADLNLTACPYPSQVRRLMFAYVEEERRFRRHELTLPPDAAILEPLDALSWTSATNGYTTKIFEVAEVMDDLQTGNQRVMLQERDPADYSYPGLPGPTGISTLAVVPADQVVELFAVSGASIPDAAGAARRPALSLTWEPDLADVTGILWEVRVQATATVMARGSTQDVATGALFLTEGILASTVYEVRAKPVADRPAAWTSWAAATTPALLIDTPDIADLAVTVQIQTVVLPVFNRASLSVGTVLATLDMGAVGAGQLWRRGMHFEGKTVFGFPSPTVTIELQRRFAILGGGFNAWAVLETFDVTGLNWEIYADSGNLSGTYDDYEYRLRVTAITGSIVSTEWIIRNIYMTTARVSK